MWRWRFLSVAGEKDEFARHRGNMDGRQWTLIITGGCSAKRAMTPRLGFRRPADMTVVDRVGPGAFRLWSDPHSLCLRHVQRGKLADGTRSNKCPADDNGVQQAWACHC
jgi:hypothetical protein